MRDLIRKQLTEYRAEALHSMQTAEDRIWDKAYGPGRHTKTFQLFTEDKKTAFAECIDRSGKFIRNLAGSSATQCTDELRNSANKLKQEIMNRFWPDLSINIFIQELFFIQQEKKQRRLEFEAALDKIINRKVEDFELGLM